MLSVEIVVIGTVIASAIAAMMKVTLFCINSLDKKN